MEMAATRTIFNTAQLYILNVMSRVQDEQELNDIKNILSRHFAEKALDGIDALWEQGVLNDDVMETWKHEHMRTHYSATYGQRCS